MADEPVVQWKNTTPGRVWRSVCGRYAIVAQTLDESPPRAVFQARKIDPAMVQAYPGRRSLGYLLEESPWGWNTENAVHSAQAVIERDAFASANPHSIPADYPAERLERFYWPISNGTTRAALALVRKDNGHLAAQVVGMCRHEYEFEPSVYVEIELPNSNDSNT